MLRQVPLVTGETYHIFNRGAHKQNIFTSDEDYRRFQVNLHLANHTHPIVVRDILGSPKYREPFSEFPSDKGLVDVLGYSLLPNHFHIILQQKTDGGITRFMKKVGVGYSMYFNLKYGHSGTLFQGSFKSNHIDTDPYHQWIFAYVHLNAVSLIDPGWKERGIVDTPAAQRFLDTYKYSSHFDYYSVERPERAILAYDEGQFLIEKKAGISGLLQTYTRGKFLNEESVLTI